MYTTVVNYTLGFLSADLRREKLKNIKREGGFFVKLKFYIKRESPVTQLNVFFFLLDHGAEYLMLWPIEHVSGPIFSRVFLQS
jgi:hypothetical protein